MNAFSAYAGGGVQGFALPLQKRPRGESPDSASTVRSVLEKKKNGNVAGKDGQEEEDEEDSADERPRATTFGEKLRAGKDDEDEETLNEEKNKVTLTEQECKSGILLPWMSFDRCLSVTTGEEDEETIHQVRGKLYMLIDGAWKERGTGLLKLNVRASDGSGARLREYFSIQTQIIFRFLNCRVLTVMRKEAVYALLLNVPLFYGMKCELAQDPRYVRFSVIESGAATHYNLRVRSHYQSLSPNRFLSVDNSSPTRRLLKSLWKRCSTTCLDHPPYEPTPPTIPHILTYTYISFHGTKSPYMQYLVFLWMRGPWKGTQG